MSRRVVLVPVVVEETRHVPSGVALLAALALALTVGAVSCRSHSTPVDTAPAGAPAVRQARDVRPVDSPAARPVMGWDVRCVPAVPPPGVCPTSTVGGRR